MIYLAHIRTDWQGEMLIKIGHTIQEPADRWRGIKSRHPGDKVRFLIFAEGDLAVEKALHNEFKKYHGRMISSKHDYFWMPQDIVNSIVKRFTPIEWIKPKSYPEDEGK